MSSQLANCLADYFQSYLREQKALSPHTIKSYRDTFKLLIAYVGSKRRQALSIRDLDVKRILDFLRHLEDTENGRSNSAQTRNQRLAAIQSFFAYLSMQHPNFGRLVKRILAIPMKRVPRKMAESLNRMEMEALLAQPQTDSIDGARDLAILAFLYNAGARAQEVADARISWFDFPNRTVAIIGKGNKQRLTPLWPSTVRLLTLYQKSYRRKPKVGTDHFFINQRGTPFTRFGVRSIVKRYIKLAVGSCPSLANKRLSTHSLRHTTAVHLLEARVDPNVIKSWLGHASIASTSRYLDTDLNYKRKILEQFGPPNYVTSVSEQKPQASADKILDWLNDL